MKKINLVLLFLVFMSGIALAESFPSLNIKRTVYVSSSSGDDRNDGTEKHPLRTISAVNSFKDVRILLKRGDVFFERLYSLSGCEVDAYGVGEKPIICGFKILDNTRAWKRVGNNIWRLDLTNSAYFKGYSAKYTTNKIQYNNIGIIYDWGTDRIYANMVPSTSDLLNNFDFHTEDKLVKSELSDKSFKYLYLYYKGKPSKLGNLCFSVGETAVDVINNCRISNIAIVGWGVHGINLVKNSVISNCDIDLIGGSLHSTGKFGRLGNGVQVWVVNKPTQNVIVKGCQITRTYDTATTIQGSTSDVSDAENIHFVGNRIAFCRQAFERYLHNDSKHHAQYKNCEFSGNVVYKSGQNGFGLPSQGNNAHLLSYENDSKQVSVSNNIFFDGNLYFSSFFAKGVKDNIVYIYPDQYLNNKHGKDARINAGDKSAAELYKQRTGDASKIVVIVKGSDEERLVEKAVLEKLSLKMPHIDLGKIIGI